MKRRNFLQIATGSIAIPFILPSGTKAKTLPADIGWNKTWHKILKMGYDRNMVVFDQNATLGEFSHELATIVCEVQCYNHYEKLAKPRLTLTDIYMPDYAFEKYGYDFVDVTSTLTWCEDDTQNEEEKTYWENEREYRLYQESLGNQVVDINCRVNLHPLTKLNYKNEYSNYLIDQLGAKSYSNHKDFAVGLRLGKHGPHNNMKTEDILLMSF